MKHPTSLSQTARRLAWIMFVVGDLLVALQILFGVLLASHLGSHPAWTVIVSVFASVTLIVTTCVVVIRLSSGGGVVALAGASYLLKIVVLLGCLISANLAGLDTQFVGIALLVVIVVTVVAEVVCLSKARIPIITPDEDQPRTR